MKDKSLTMLIIVAILVGLLLVGICFYLGYRYFVNTRQKLNNGTAELAKFREDLNKNKLSRAETIQGYNSSLYHCQSTLSKYLDSDNWFKISLFIDACKKNLKTDSIDLFKCVVLYLEKDIHDNLDGEMKLQALNDLKTFKFMINDMKNVLMRKPTHSLKLYSNYFVKLLDICSCISNGIKDKHITDNKILNDLQKINNLIFEYEPISRLYSNINESRKHVLQIINERYRGRIIAFNDFYEIWDATCFLVFDDIINYIERYYLCMDDIDKMTKREK